MIFRNAWRHFAERARWCAVRRKPSALPFIPNVADTKSTAIHEAGHVLVYAALVDLPTDLHVVVTVLGAEAGLGRAGYVQGTLQTGRDTDTEAWLSWWMHVKLAGRCAEAMCGDPAMGCQADEAEWLELAKLYLSNGARGVFYAEPLNAFEAEINHRMLTALREEQLVRLQVFLARNREVLDRVAQALEWGGRLDREALLSLLSTVVVSDDLPRPQGRPGAREDDEDAW